MRVLGNSGEGRWTEFDVVVVGSGAAALTAAIARIAAWRNSVRKL